METSSKKEENVELPLPIFPHSHAIILADEFGGSPWSAIWDKIPKQFVKLQEIGGKSLFEKALERTQKAIYPKNIRIVTHESYLEYCISQAHEAGVPITEEQIFTGSSHKGKLVSILIALEGIPDDEVVVVFNSDHVLNIQSFCERAKSLMPFGDEKIILYTVSARAPITNRGYVKLADPQERISPIVALRENASELEVKEYIREWFVWDSGIYAFRKRVFLEELRKIDPTIEDRVREGQSDPVLFEKIPTPSLYSGFLEKSQNVLGIQVEDITIVDTEDTSIVDSRKTYYMPWGMVNIVHEWPTYRVRKLTVNPEQKIPLQSHIHRTEAWSVGYGVAKVTIGSETRYLQRGESATIPIGIPHRLENPWKTPLVILENQIGDYLGDDDVIYVEEWYGKIQLGL